MTRWNHVGGVLQELGNEMGMGALELDEHDKLSLLFDGVLVTFAYTSDPIEMFWIYVDLGEIPAGDVNTLNWLLQIGFECWSHNLMTVGLSEDGCKAVGYSVIPVTLLDHTMLIEVLNAMLQTTFEIKDRLTAGNFENVEEAAIQPLANSHQQTATVDGR